MNILNPFTDAKIKLIVIVLLDITSDAPVAPAAKFYAMNYKRH